MLCETGTRQKKKKTSSTRSGAGSATDGRQQAGRPGGRTRHTLAHSISLGSPKFKHIPSLLLSLPHSDCRFSLFACRSSGRSELSACSNMAGGSGSHWNQRNHETCGLTLMTTRCAATRSPQPAAQMEPELLYGKCISQKAWQIQGSAYWNNF